MLRMGHFFLLLGFQTQEVEVCFTSAEEETELRMDLGLLRDSADCKRSGRGVHEFLFLKFIQGACAVCHLQEVDSLVDF